MINEELLMEQLQNLIGVNKLLQLEIDVLNARLLIIEDSLGLTEGGETNEEKSEGT